MTLTVDELREHVGSGPSDDVLDRLLTAAYATITERYGATEYDETVSELLSPSGSLVVLSRRATEIVSVKEGNDSLDVEDDVVLRPGGKYLLRIDSSGHRTAWSGLCDITYTPESDEADRNRVAIALVNLDLNHNPGMTGTTTGPWQEQYANNSVWNYAEERDAILRTLRPRAVGVW